MTVSVHLPFKQILFRLKFRRVSLRRGGACTNRLMEMGTSTDTLPVHGKWTENVSTLSGTKPLAGIFNCGGCRAPCCVSYSMDSTYGSYVNGDGVIRERERFCVINGGMWLCGCVRKRRGMHIYEMVHSVKPATITHMRRARLLLLFQKY